MHSNLSENNMDSVKMRCGFGGNEELRSICVLAAIGHAQQEGLIVFGHKCLILEDASID